MSALFLRCDGALRNHKINVFLPKSYRSTFIQIEVAFMFAQASLSSKFQISIPKAVREEQRWEAGQVFVFLPKGKGVLLMPVPELDELVGLAQGADPQNARDREDRY
jgi:AbrB family looped-hinge helix DNA binding protein